MVVGISAAIALAFLLGGAVPRVGHAQVLKCERDWLDDLDDMTLRAAALKVLPKSVHVNVTGACKNSEWARGYIETPKNITAEGVQQWYEFACWRQAQPWKCDPPEFKQFIATSIEVGGVAHSVELSFDKGSSLQSARLLAAGAIEAYADRASRLPECGRKEPKDSDLLRNWDHYVPLPAGDNKISISVSSNTKFSVDLDDFAVEIEFQRTDDSAGFRAECWGLYVIVT